MGVIIDPPFALVEHDDLEEAGTGAIIAAWSGLLPCSLAGSVCLQVQSGKYQHRHPRNQLVDA
jgi:hypothetical protein